MNIYNLIKEGDEFDFSKIDYKETYKYKNKYLDGHNYEKTKEELPWWEGWFKYFIDNKYYIFNVNNSTFEKENKKRNVIVFFW